MRIAPEPITGPKPPRAPLLHDAKKWNLAGGDGVVDAAYRRLWRRPMKLTVISLALAATAFGSLAANAQTTIIQEERPPAAVVVTPVPAESTTVTHERGGFLGTESRTTTTTNGSGALGDCSSRTVHKQDLLGEKTVSRTNCP
jgi:hypothetical protein